MARQGQFGRAATGASNLSDAIRSLVQQQWATDEKALMDAFYGGLQYNGAIPTMADVIAFYNNYTSVAGIDQGTSEWNLVQQKIEQANNVDISNQYGNIISEFKSSKGANFAEVMSFLKGRAQDSTNQDHLATYNEAISNVAQNFISFRSNDLRGGIINAATYRTMVDDVISSLDPLDPMRSSILVDSFASEWEVMNNKKRDLVAIGKLSASGYASWAKSFAQGLLSSGLTKGNTTYLDALAAAASGLSAGGGPGNVKLTNTSNELAGIWKQIKAQYAGDAGSFWPGEGQSTTDLLKEIAIHPEWLQKYANAIDAGNLEIPAFIKKATGQDGGEAMITYFGDLLATGTNIAARSGSKEAVYWNAAEHNAGTSTAWRTIKTVDDIWQKNRSDAKGDGQLLKYLDGEYAKFLRGDDSYYGKLNSNPLSDAGAGMLTPYQRTLVANQAVSLAGGYVQGMQTVSGAGITSQSDLDAVSTRLSTIAQVGVIGDQLKSGELTNVWNSQTQMWDPTPGTALGLKNGKFTYVSVTKLGEGQLVSEVRTIDAKPIISIDANGKTSDSGYRSVFNPETGEQIFVDLAGIQYAKDAFSPIGSGGYIINATVDTPSKKLELASRIVYRDVESGLIIDGKYDSTDPNAALANVDDLKVASGLIAEQIALGVYDPALRDILLGDSLNSGQLYDILVAPAEDKALAALQATPTDPKDLEKRSKIQELSGNADYSNFLKTQLETPTYREVSPNVWQPIEANAQRENGFLNTAGQLSNWWSGQDPLTKTLSLPLVALRGAALTVGAIGETLINGVSQPTIDMRSQEQKAADNARGLAAAAPQVSAYERSGYGQAPGGTFFRNMNTTPVAPQQMGSSYLGLQATAPKPVAPIPLAVKPSAIKIVGAPGFGAVMTSTPKAAPVFDAMVFAGKGGGGR